ncbi:hypothetical protein [Siminovitchia terrae]|uniref:hypothetical protein n=1 Tax=Siminovitchia terrae TaxID=1914933 RepID=UPI00163B6CF7|nr:hypothetical protein [Siminovitchia terrae]
MPSPSLYASPWSVKFEEIETSDRSFTSANDAACAALIVIPGIWKLFGRTAGAATNKAVVAMAAVLFM